MEGKRGHSEINGKNKSLFHGTNGRGNVYRGSRGLIIVVVMREGVKSRQWHEIWRKDGR